MLPSRKSCCTIENGIGDSPNSRSSCARPLAIRPEPFQVVLAEAKGRIGFRKQRIRKKRVQAVYQVVHPSIGTVDPQPYRQVGAALSLETAEDFEALGQRANGVRDNWRGPKSSMSIQRRETSAATRVGTWRGQRRANSWMTATSAGGRA